MAEKEYSINQMVEVLRYAVTRTTGEDPVSLFSKPGFCESLKGVLVKAKNNAVRSTSTRFLEASRCFDEEQTKAILDSLIEGVSSKPPAFPKIARIVTPEIINTARENLFKPQDQDIVFDSF